MCTRLHSQVHRAAERHREGAEAVSVESLTKDREETQREWKGVL